MTLKTMCFAALSVWMATGTAVAQVNRWQLGGTSGLVWSSSDTSRIMIDLAAAPTAIQPIYISPASSVFSLLEGWSPVRDPFGFVDGERPRAWRGIFGNDRPDRSGVNLVDGDSTTYNPAESGRSGLYYTLDLAVPVPVFQFGFYTPSTGTRLDGLPLRDDAVPAYEISLATESSAAISGNGAYERLEKLVADVPVNFQNHVQISFPRQYVRFVRYRRKESILDQEIIGSSGDFTTGSAARGTIADFELFGEGYPKRAVYVTHLLDLGTEVNFGRLLWSATAMRRVDGKGIEMPGEEALVQVELRSGLDADPTVYHEFTDEGDERVVSRERYEKDLRDAFVDVGAGVTQEGKPGIRASVSYDQENWSFWSFPIVQAGQPARLRRGRYLQAKIILKSADFDQFVRLDSLWIEHSPPLARRVLGEMARLNEPQPSRGFTEVELGAPTDFTCDLRAEFDAADQPGFDALRIRTDGRPVFVRLEMGESATPIEPVAVSEKEGELVVHLPERITRDHNLPLRVVFTAQIFNLTAPFESEVFDAAGQTLPQQVEGGNAIDAVNTNSLSVFGVAGKNPAVIQDLRFSTPLFTPNGDGIHDRLAISYALFRLSTPVPAKLTIYRLDGTLLREIELGEQGVGPQQVFWNGRDAAGELLTPGLYLVDIELQSGSRTAHQVRPVGIAY